jgi:L-2-hydroxyglutarate oxidase
LERFCDEEGVPWKRCGTLLVAAGGEEDWLRRWGERAETVGEAAEWWSADRLREMAPRVAGRAALHVPTTGIVDYQAVCACLARRVHELGGEFFGGVEVRSWIQADGEVRARSNAGEFRARVLWNCAGVEAEALARRSGHDPGGAVVPLRNGYWELDARARLGADWILRRVPRPGEESGLRNLRLLPTTDGRVEFRTGLALAWRSGTSRSSGGGLDGWGRLLRQPGVVPWLRQEAAELWGAQRLHGSRFRAAEEAGALWAELEPYQLDRVRPGRTGLALRADGTVEPDLATTVEGRVAHVWHVPEEGATAVFAVSRHLVGLLVPQLL